MAELLPLVQAENIRQSMLDYLTTTFALTDAAAASALKKFLQDPEDGIFRGPYVKTSLPFASATGSSALEWDPEFEPYGHQAAAFARLASSRDGVPVRPKPTIVTTGTGSGKTEAFLYPIIDHVLRARRGGQQGIKALILYPMNALANDQAGRIAELLVGRPELEGVTAALYTGQQGADRSVVTAEGLITDRYAIRESAPDILLTNYKMLDQLLLRAGDQTLWKQSADSLQYLVLDEFHTYDGAQGTDVAMLLRRLGLTLRSYADKSLYSEADLARPLGRITPVGTSATLGADSVGEMLQFAETVFGERFTTDSLVGETRQTVTQWVGNAQETLEARGVGLVPVADLRPGEIAADLQGVTSPTVITSVVVRALTAREMGAADLADVNLQQAVLQAHPLVQAVVRATERAVNLSELPGAVPLLEPHLGGAQKQRDWQGVLAGVINALGHVRSEVGRSAVSTEVHLWLRELTRIDRLVSDDIHFYWSDEGPRVAESGEQDPKPDLPAIYCRRCGRSGWAVQMAPVGDMLSLSDADIRVESLRKTGRVRSLISAPLESGDRDARTSDLAWLNMRQRTLTRQQPDPNDPDVIEGWVQPVLANLGEHAEEQSNDQTCPACEFDDAIRFMGSAISTMLSVSISTLFGAAGLDDSEKHALVFTDSVQDAAHRAGFIRARSHSLSLRSVLADAIDTEEMTLEDLPADVMDRAGSDPVRRHRLVPPNVTEQPLFSNYWKTAGLSSGERRASKTAIANRMAFDATLEFGLNSRIGRTLELTGTVNVAIDAGPDQLLLNAAKEAIGIAGFQTDLLSAGSGGPSREQLLHWVRGTIVRMRTQGGIYHPWLGTYIQEDGNRYSIWGGRDRSKGIPAFPAGRPAPSFPRVGGKPVRYEQFDSVSSSQSWYAKWAAQVLGVSDREGAGLATELFRQLAALDIVQKHLTKSGATVYSFSPQKVILQRSTDEELAGGKITLECDLCRSLTPVSPEVSKVMVGSPCSSLRCGGTLRQKRVTENFYRDMYQGSAMRRVVSREHTGLLEDEVRLAYEQAFKNPQGAPDAPNVLVATPTLEMGIDIGDLSAVFLSSIPKHTSNYRQRVGRAGRRTGNALAVTYGTGRGPDLPRVKNPKLLIDGPIRPPATYLSAEELVRRQYTAALADSLAREPGAPHPVRAGEAMGSTDPGTFLGALIGLGERGAGITEFASSLGNAGTAAEAMLRQWTTVASDSHSSGMALEFASASAKWNSEVEEIGHRITATEAMATKLEEKVASPACTSEDRRELRDAKASLSRLRRRRKDLLSEHWISVLEEFGILPNYTLFDDSVTLGVGMSWRDSETGEYQTDSVEVARSSAMALREFAPGSTFYAKGLEIEIDAVDLGPNGQAVEQWALCSVCGFVETDGMDYTLCPRCGDTGIADSGSQVPVVQLRRATAEIHRDEALISDNTDERKQTRFEMVEAVDFDPALLRNRWSVPGVLGVELYESVSVRTLNLGRGGGGVERIFAGQKTTSGLFRLCEGCGKQDRRPGANTAQEHRPWCKYRNTVEEQVHPVALAHHLRTQGLVLHLPAAIALDGTAKASVSAALRAGLQRVLGGDPDHLEITSVPVPEAVGIGVMDGLLLYDQIPGGTGYLPDWSEPGNLHNVLSAAYRVVRDCSCAAAGQESCHNCLLPFARPGSSNFLSRAAAEKALADLLLVEDDSQPDYAKWDVHPEEIDMLRSTESALEVRFREELRARLENLVTIQSTVSGSGEAWRFGSPGGAGGRTWNLLPQVNEGFTKPDFVLKCNDTNIPDVDIYTDGYEYHATVRHLRLEDDAFKREQLCAEGKVVLAVTAADLEKGAPKLPPLLPADVLGAVQQDPLLAAQPAAFQMIQKRPLDWLIEWISDPQPEELRVAARSIPFGLPPAQGTVTIADSVTLEELALSIFEGEVMQAQEHGAGRTVVVYREGPLVFLVEMDPQRTTSFLVAIDDLEAPDKQSWHRWLRYANAVALRDWPTVITTSRLLAAGLRLYITAESLVLLAAVDTSLWSEEWQQAAEASGEESELRLFEQLIEAGVQVAPDVGEELASGVPVDLSWERERIAVSLVALSDQDVADLEADGWELVDADAALIADRLQG